MDEDKAELLAHGIAFGAQVGTAIIGAKSAAQLFKEAKKINVHKNSLKFNGPTHIYKITDERGSIHKISESAQGLNKHGLSKRAEQQVRQLRKQTGKRYRSDVIEWHKGKGLARARETQLIRETRSKDPNALPGNKGDH
jgi:predicted GNAT family acetyltransferase